MCFNFFFMYLATMVSYIRGLYRSEFLKVKTMLLGREPVKFSKPLHYNNQWSKDNRVCLFLPAAGLRNNSNGTLDYRGTYGFYWSSTVYDASTATRMSFTSGGQNTAATNKPLGFSVRCVAAFTLNLLSCKSLVWFAGTKKKVLISQPARADLQILSLQWFSTWQKNR